MHDFRSQFLLDPDITFLNHGSFGATPKAVLDVYQQWQRTLEQQPVLFLDRRFKERMLVARTGLAEYIGCAPEDLVYVPNPTTAGSMVARSLDLQPGDEILGTDHEYGAMNRLWSFISKQTGARYIPQAVPLPLTTAEDFVERVWAGVTERTRVLFLSHITSQTALTFPIAPLIERARERGILTVIDGAHAPGQIPLDMVALDADFYIGACHKWLCAPKGAAFLYAHKRVQAMLDPLVVSWGYESLFPSDSQFIDHHELQGTRDISAFLSVPAAIKYQHDHHWDTVRRDAHALVLDARRRLLALTESVPMCPEDGGWFQQMTGVELPALDGLALKSRLWDEYRIEVPIILWQERLFIRVSIQAYNEPKDVDALLSALATLIPELRETTT